MRIDRTHRFMAPSGVLKEIEQMLGQAGNYESISMSIWERPTVLHRRTLEVLFDPGRCDTLGEDHGLNTF